LRAQALDARSADLSLKLGWCCAATGMHRESVQWMTSAVATDPDSVEARFGLATVLSNVGQRDESQRQLEFVLARQPRHYKGLIQLGEHKLASKDFVAAEALFRNAIAAEPRNPIGWLTLTSVLYVQDGQTKRPKRWKRRSVSRPRRAPTSRTSSILHREERRRSF
jgi:Tfp pilus assembly protein PilF